MTKLVICLLFFGLFTIQTVGHMNSDPAPGRSPGPPADNVVVTRVAIGASTTNANANNNYPPVSKSIINATTINYYAAAQEPPTQLGAPIADTNHSVKQGSNPAEDISSEINFKLGKFDQVSDSSEEFDPLGGIESIENIANMVNGGNIKANRRHQLQNNRRTRSSLYAELNEPANQQSFVLPPAGPITTNEKLRNTILTTTTIATRMTNRTPNNTTDNKSSNGSRGSKSSSSSNSVITNTNTPLTTVTNVRTTRTISDTTASATTTTTTTTSSTKAKTQINSKTKTKAKTNGKRASSAPSSSMVNRDECDKGLSDFFNDVLVIDLDEPEGDDSIEKWNDTTAETDEQEQHHRHHHHHQESSGMPGGDADILTEKPDDHPYRLRIRLALDHDVFDTRTTTAAGINCGLMYKVHLTTMMASPATGTTTTPHRNQHNGAAVPFHYSGEFFVETVSALNGRERGSFIGHPTSGNKLPISWFTGLHRGKGYLQNDGVQKFSSDLRNGTSSGFGFASTSASASVSASATAYVTGGDARNRQRNAKGNAVTRNGINDFNINDSSRRTNGSTANVDNNEESNAASSEFAVPSNNDFNSASNSGEDNYAFLLQHDRQDIKRNSGNGDNSGVEANSWLGTPSQNMRKSSRNTNVNINGNGGGTAAFTTATDKTDGASCSENRWRDNVKSHGSVTGEPSEAFTDSGNLWLLNEKCNQDDVIEFRIFFRATVRSSNTEDGAYNAGPTVENDANAEVQHVVYKKTYKFRLHKDCHLWLRESSPGSIDYTALPSNTNDCTVHFPSYASLTNTANADGKSSDVRMAPPGLLVELQRLNVPCISGGFVQVNGATKLLCGKLEELQSVDRVYHFDVRHEVSIRFFRNPMFSLSYKLVDYCYNITTSNQSGDFYIQPSRRDSMECFFRIHLPYGNRILLRLVTNNRSDILPFNDVNSGDGVYRGMDIMQDPKEEQTIYTDLGERIPTQVINLTITENGIATRYAVKNRSGSVVKNEKTSAKGPDTFSYLSMSNANLMVSSLAAAVNCDGVVIKVFENDHSKWSHCVSGLHLQRGFVLESASNTISVHLFRAAPSVSMSGATGETNNDGGSDSMTEPGNAVYLSYQARPMPEVVSNCAFGWIAMQQFCVSAIQLSRTWYDAEKHCQGLGGHLASIRNDVQQKIINDLLLNSPGYHDQNAYWVGGSDDSYEGDFRWSDGLLFQYTNWFSGWSQHGYYNKQPNDDGLSSQDCIELRRYFRAPPGMQAQSNSLTSTFMWNDRDCAATNLLICERAMSEESFRRSWINDCNKTVSLSKEHSRAAIWSPSFPRQYPDNANCYTTITAPTGYRIVIEFEELVIENEQGCTYDYLEITEPSQFDATKSSKSSKHKSNSNTSSSNSNVNNSNNNNNRKTFRKRSSYENPSLSSYTSDYNYNENTNDNSLYSTSYNNYNLAQINYQKLLHIFEDLYRPHSNFLVRTPDYPKGNPHLPHNFNTATLTDPDSIDVMPRRLCGDWSTKLKLLRHVSSSSYLGLHFVSDYSHHFGGYKAKAYMENRSSSLRAASECANERLKAYNGSCYLFVSYPEVDWSTAQQVCRAMGAKLSSVSSSDEHRFITSNIRNQIDYSPQLIYWLGAELEKNGQFEWTDDTKMSFQSWLPGQERFDVMPSDAICLGLQWKMSPTPMLPSGLYWQSQKCNKVGGYVCKKPKDSFGMLSFSNFTVTGNEGRLVSPAYPNTYPLNMDYWVHIQSPERTRIVVQFQKIDLEPQDECLYDFISIEDYELASSITLEPGTNIQPMAMLTSEEQVFGTIDGSEDGVGSELRVQRDSRWLRRRRRRRRATDGNISGNTAKRRRRKRNTANDVNLDRMDKSEIQMKNLNEETGEEPSNGGTSIRKSSPNSDKLTKRMTRDGKRIYRKNYGRTLRRHSDENPKRRRRKNLSSNPREAIRLNPFKSRSAALEKRNDNRLWRKVLQVRQGHRKRRSTIFRDTMTGTAMDNAQTFLPYVRWCGLHDSIMSKFDFVSSSNQVLLNFHSDYSIAGLGFAATWKAIDISGCPSQTLTSREGNIFSPNHPHFLLNNLNCAYIIQAPVGRRVWLEFNEYSLYSDAILEIDIGHGLFKPFRFGEHLNEGIFVSQREQFRVQLRTGPHPRGRGFRATYRTVDPLERRERIISLQSNATGYLYQLNYPDYMPERVDFTQHLVAPFGDNILLELHGVEFTENGCTDNNMLEIYDNYADNNGTKWQLCKFQNGRLHPGTVNSPGVTKFDSTEPYLLHNRLNSLTASEDNIRLLKQLQQPPREQQQLQLQRFIVGTTSPPALPAPPPVYITSYLNTLHIHQRTTAHADAILNATVRVQWDNNYKMKLATGDKTVESCQPNPCQYNGKCVTNNGTNYCQCQGHYTGRFCGLNLCELEPCVFGICELTTTNFKCQCQPGYMGTTCEQKQRPCADNPCEGRGICYEKNGGYFCRCHAWWEGHRCEKRMMHIPYKPLSERMLQEPFWLGLITVFVVLAVIGLVWCAKRHFPEKIEKLLAEEADRNRPPGSIHGHHHHTSLREQLQFTTAIPQTTVNNAPGAPRSIFNRLGIRKPSLLSLSSPNPTHGGGGAAARTFSLDDLLRPPPRRSPSPRKKRNNSTPVKKNAADKIQILQQLVSPPTTQSKPKVSLGELISMSENRLRTNTLDSESDLKETTFSENSGSIASNSVSRTIADSKLEKKVTFARLLNKVSAEMSSSSEVDQMGGTRNSSALSLPTDIQFRASSTPPSPCTADMRSPHSTSSNQGSDSLSSSDLALTDFGLRSMQLVGNEIIHASNYMGGGGGGGLHMGGSGAPSSRYRIGSSARPKVSSADSILAMFRNFASTATTASNTTTATIQSSHASASVFISPSTTPTVSSPQDDAPGDDESSTSSMHTPVSFSSGPPDSPVFYRQTTIEVPVLDVINAHKNSSPSSSNSSSSANLLHPPTILLEIPSNGINKCLSPIREMPTPMPSPALTPIMPRPQRSNSPIFQEDPLSGGDYTDDEDKSEDHTESQLSEKLILGLKKEQARALAESDMETSFNETATTSMVDHNRQSLLPTKKAPLLRLPNITLAPPPLITIDVEPPTPEERQPRPRDLIIPTLTVEQPSPTKNRHPMIIFPGSPPPQRASIGETSFMFPNKQQQKRLLKQFEKPTSLEFPFVPPMITITSNMSEAESDTEPLSPAPKTGGLTSGGLMPPNPVGMCYLSPFTMCSRADRTISESNLSSSGYSSMASPGPSRCGSSNPLCPNEMDEPGSGHSGAGFSLHVNLLNRRKSSTLASCKENITNGKGSGSGSESGATGSNVDQLHHGHRLRSDSETFSDDILIESNDEGIGTDHIDEKLDDTRLSEYRLKALDMFMEEEQVLIEVDEPLPSLQNVSSSMSIGASQMAQLQLPSIVIQIEGNDKGLSPVSSRSESPLSERAGIGRFSPHFYGRKDQLPFTDSDGLYDFPSSDGKGGTSHQVYTHQRRSSSKKRERERKSSKCSATQSPTKLQLDVPHAKDSMNTSTSPTGNIHVCNKHCHSHHHPCPAAAVTTRKSPKRRMVNRLPIASTSSSSESLTSAKEISARPLPRRLNSPNRERQPRKQESLSEDEVADALLRRISPSIVKEDESAKPKCKINRLRAIGNQIRFLRRLKKSIKTRERISSPTDSCPEENTDDMDSPQATSPLLQLNSPSKTRMALCRQKRVPNGAYGITAAAMNTSSWKGTDQSLIGFGGDEIHSD